MESPPGIVFELQWRKRSRAGSVREEDRASIGIWDVDDASLNWLTFKSYLCQNLGTSEDISVAYIDSDGDELPIESDCEFQEALKFARQRAHKGKEIILKVEKQDSPSRGRPTWDFLGNEVPPKDSAGARHERKQDSERDSARPTDCLRSPITLQALPILRRNKPESVSVQIDAKGQSEEKKEEKTNEKKQKSPGNYASTNWIPCVRKTKDRGKLEGMESPPLWFKKYMQKWKAEIVSEVSTNMTFAMSQMLEEAKLSNGTSMQSCPRTPCCCSRTSSWSVPRLPKKKNSDEDSSDGAIASDQREYKLLKKLEKLHKREKKLEKKLDSKLEKLEHKTKRIMEKKSREQSRSRPERVGDRRYLLRKKSNDASVNTSWMDVTLVKDETIPNGTHVKRSSSFTKIWRVKNSGAITWTDKTELQLDYTSNGLVPDVYGVKCPALTPGEEGQISVNYVAPSTPGRYESYWHFYHNEERFGQWIGFSVVVDADTPATTTNQALKENSPPVAFDVATKQLEDDFQKIYLQAEAVNSGLNSFEMKEIDTKRPTELNIKCQEVECTQNVSPAPAESAGAKVCDVVDCGKDVPAAKERNDVPETIGCLKQRTESLRAEYESDSDNLSVLSGSVLSLSSDAEDNFVVVPMPPCFLCDVPLGSPGSVPEVIKDCAESKKSSISRERSSIEMKSSPITAEVVSDASLELCSDTNYEEALEDLRPLAEELKSPPQSTPRTVETLAKLASDEFSKKCIFAVDMSGRCVSLDQAQHQNNSQMQETVSESIEELSTPSHTPSFGETIATGTAHVEVGEEEQGKVADEPASDKNARHGDLPSQLVPAVHILPEALVTGAINVAKAVLNNLRAIPATETPESPQNQSVTQPPSSEATDLLSPMEMLVEMGFANREKNAELLRKYDNDISKVVTELLVITDSDWHTSRH